MRPIIHYLIFGLLAAGCTSSPEPTQEVAAEPIEVLPSWNSGQTRDAIISFVEHSVDPQSEFFIPENERIAVFDNDGTLWGEKPVYFQLLYAMDYIREHADEHPEWASSEAVRHVLNNDMEAFMAGGEHAILELVMYSHAGMSASEFSQSVKNWLNTSRHPDTGRPYNRMIYQPMLELLDYLRDNEFKTFIVSGGGIDFMRVWASEAYNIPPYQIVGSSIEASYDNSDGMPRIIKNPKISFIDDKAGKPVGIHQHIGMKPVFAGGNSDGDYEMIEYTTSGNGPGFGLFIHHTDSVREYAYDRSSSVGRLDRGLDDAAEKGWVIVDMAADWSKVYPDN